MSSLCSVFQHHFPEAEQVAEHQPQASLPHLPQDYLYQQVELALNQEMKPNMGLWGSSQSRRTSRWHSGCGSSWLASQDAACKERRVECETSQWRQLVMVGNREVKDQMKAHEDTKTSMEKRENRLTSVRKLRDSFVHILIFNSLDQP